MGAGIAAGPLSPRFAVACWFRKTRHVPLWSAACSTRAAGRWASLAAFLPMTAPLRANRSSASGGLPGEGRASSSSAEHLAVALRTRRSCEALQSFLRRPARFPAGGLKPCVDPRSSVSRHVAGESAVMRTVRRESAPHFWSEDPMCFAFGNPLPDPNPRSTLAEAVVLACPGPRPRPSRPPTPLRASAFPNRTQVLVISAVSRRDPLCL